MKTQTAAIAAALATAWSGAASAGLIANAVITADNHYAIFADGPMGLNYYGGNETGAGGNPGQYNWSKPETYAFETDGKIYLAAWSDDSVAQGLLAAINLSNGDTLHSGDARWEVYPTGINRGTGDPHPTVPEMVGHIATADMGDLWEVPFVGGANGIAPWGTIPGISSDIRWMWYNTPGDSDPLSGGSGAGELLIFRVCVPTPGTATLAGLGGMMLLRRRR